MATASLSLYDFNRAGKKRQAELIIEFEANMIALDRKNKAKEVRETLNNEVMIDSKIGGVPFINMAALRLMTLILNDIVPQDKGEWIKLPAGVSEHEKIHLTAFFTSPRTNMEKLFGDAIYDVITYGFALTELVEEDKGFYESIPAKDVRFIRSNGEVISIMITRSMTNKQFAMLYPEIKAELPEDIKLNLGIHQLTTGGYVKVAFAAELESPIIKWEIMSELPYIITSWPWQTDKLTSPVIQSLKLATELQRVREDVEFFYRKHLNPCIVVSDPEQTTNLFNPGAIIYTTPGTPPPKALILGGQVGDLKEIIKEMESNILAMFFLNDGQFSRATQLEVKAAISPNMATRSIIATSIESQLLEKLLSWVWKLKFKRKDVTLEYVSAITVRNNQIKAAEKLTQLKALLELNSELIELVDMDEFANEFLAVNGIKTKRKA